MIQKILMIPELFLGLLQVCIPTFVGEFVDNTGSIVTPAFKTRTSTMALNTPVLRNQWYISPKTIAQQL
jgi:hypothetical protein